MSSVPRMPEWGPKAGHLLEEPPPGCSDVGTAVGGRLGFRI